MVACYSAGQTLPVAIGFQRFSSTKTSLELAGTSGVLLVSLPASGNHLICEPRKVCKAGASSRERRDGGGSWGVEG